MAQYVLAQPTGAKKTAVYQVSRQSNGDMIGVIPDHSMYGEKTTHRIRASEVVLPLGDNPPVGKVYGTHVEPVLARWLVNGWGPIYNHVRGLSPDLRDRISRTIVSAKRLVNRQYDGATSHEIITEIRAEHGTKLATYHYKSHEADTLTLRPPPAIGSRELVKVLSHELGHGVWFRVLTPEVRAAWIRLFGRYVHVREVSVQDVKSMVKGMRQMSSLRDYTKDAEPEEQAAVAIYVGWVRKVHGLDARMMQDLLSAGSSLPLPDVHLHRSDKDTPVTLYSKSAPDELFCEALSSHVVKDLKDKRLIALLNGNLKAAG